MSGLTAFLDFSALGFCALGHVPAKLSRHSPHLGRMGRQTICSTFKADGEMVNLWMQLRRKPGLEIYLQMTCRSYWGE
ncbi:hypothetical protein IW261DRAFT_1497202 [Armillaria novae-zelandiae]|uniref:Uncharacterized protein n=1 Tax=Armillaria novae-zelandiae TaxID=153914 RepID=A0AA39NZL0_9AGAR|nr:hypothetical protein IW261DRAFT_1497202 [Armillaria novae-zelandiae]